MAEPSLGLTMILKNEEANLSRSLAPVAHLFDQVVVIDTGSSDHTRQICHDLGARVYQQDWQHDFARARNYSIEKSKTDWIFWLDGDNALDQKGVANLRAKIPGQAPAIIWAREKLVPSGETLWQKRCFPKHPQVRFEGRVHEQLVHPADWPSIASDTTVLHWGYADPEEVRAKGEYYLSILNQILDKNPSDHYSHFQKARCLINLRRFEDAANHLEIVADSRQALSSNQELWVHAHILWSEALERLGRPHEARQVAAKLLQQCPDHGLVHYRAGRLAYAAGDWSGAAQHLALVEELGLGTPLLDLNLDKTLFLNAYFLSRSLEKLGEKSRAASWLERALAIEPQNLAVRLDLARLWLELERRDRAMAEINQVLKLRPGYQRAQRLLEDCQKAA